MDVLRLVKFIEETLATKIDDGEMRVENFQTLGAITALVMRKRKKSA